MCIAGLSYPDQNLLTIVNHTNHQEMIIHFDMPVHTFNSDNNKNSFKGLGSHWIKIFPYNKYCFFLRILQNSIEFSLSSCRPSCAPCILWKGNPASHVSALLRSDKNPPKPYWSLFAALWAFCLHPVTKVDVSEIPGGEISMKFFEV